MDRGREGGRKAVSAVRGVVVKEMILHQVWLDAGGQPHSGGGEKDSEVFGSADRLSPS